MTLGPGAQTDERAEHARPEGGIASDALGSPRSVILLLAVVLAVVVLPSPWGVITVGAAVVVEVGEAWFWWWFSRRRRPAVGIEAMLGQTATAVTPCRPLGQVRIQGELWQARCDAGADPGDEVRVVRVDGLTLHVEPIPR